MRYIEVSVLWLQEQALRRQLPLVKISRNLNPADLMTKRLGQFAMEARMSLHIVELRRGRTAKALELHAISGNGREKRHTRR